MHAALLISTFLFAQGHMPSLGTVFISLPVLGILLFVGSRAAFKSNAKTRAADRVLTNQVDDNGVPVFFDLSTKDGGAFRAARAVYRQQTPQR